MKTVRPIVIAAALMIAGCASSGASEGAKSGVSWWRSAIAPWNWFGSSLQVSEQGVGKLDGNTPMNTEAVSAGLDDKYKIRKGMRGENGKVVSFFQAIDGQKIRIVVNGIGTVNRIDVTDPDITTADGKKTGTPFSELYSKAFGACQKGTGNDSDGVECLAPGSKHISYLFSGKWHGPEGLLPSDDTLKTWTISKIIWRK
ncbi:RpoE-regulated lipoprotein [Erwinia psidii]|uniref:RpoE-regulated lipoprotein n=1 Tax=Erwinia psidii TaxID=69224 RepID=A0A3N6S535_9GAMM|nr:RpoE-regulated lipoprotein [Erwinia psidii]MCX8956721.1 RpoE-regulated lipoprotein [Erwinia psidii]MCX8960468.1 RpoE-regulated lipoprotein [Erwinia psidii]MCX8964349.1 RpoE-regulated lipoprotein [Erwinia psidii]RQM40047.1 RpoE-regulated lipoprotein [Erwinia psidii]